MDERAQRGGPVFGDHPPWECDGFQTWNRKKLTDSTAQKKTNLQCWWLNFDEFWNTNGISGIWLVRYGPWQLALTISDNLCWWCVSLMLLGSPCLLVHSFFWWDPFFSYAKIIINTTILQAGYTISLYNINDVQKKSQIKVIDQQYPTIIYPLAN